MTAARRGWLVTLEGVEGAGKTSVAGPIAQALEEAGWRVTRLREPGSEPVAEAIRAVLLHSPGPVAARAELMLFLAARAQMTERCIRPAVERGEVALCDRYGDSTIVYQGHARGLDLDEVRRLNAFATGGLKPDLTLLLDLSAEEGLRRQADCNRMEAEPLAFHERVREGYRLEARLEPDRWRVIDASRPLEAVARDAVAAVLARCRPA
ncbi:MAG TPA: dTMP kinase [Chthonomonadales bacterium]|nr:dTMP kinase [Chthonomonadales bacterium]